MSNTLVLCYFEAIRPSKFFGVFIALTTDLSAHFPADPSFFSSQVLIGRVTRTQSGFFVVETDAGAIVCQISGKMKIDAQRAVNKEELQRSDLVALNDFVTIETQADGTGVIVSVQERRNVLSRTAPGNAVGTANEEEQIILANADHVVFVLAAQNPSPNPRALDRLLVIAEKAEIPEITICINKIDLAKIEKLKHKFQAYVELGYSVIYLSAKTEENLSVLRRRLFGDAEKVSALVGPSGVGKSSLLNALKQGLSLQTKEVSDATTKGKHTTRFSQLIHFPDGGYIADTPGIRAIAPWDIEPDELDNYFIEFRQYIEQCKFADCSHRHEPGCAVIAAVEAGKIPATRYDSYLRLREELEAQYIN